MTPEQQEALNALGILPAQPGWPEYMASMPSLTQVDQLRFAVALVENVRASLDTGTGEKCGECGGKMRANWPHYLAGEAGRAAVGRIVKMTHLLTG
tara:strand:+ start:234 stop:521 length:288 start_codon:yes stop_codon:yes gene_type:complete